MSSTFCQRQLVMYFLNRNDDSLGIALLTERMRLCIGITNPLPRSAVPAVYSRVSVVLLVAAVIEFCVFLTEPVVCQLGTSRIVTWVFWLARHSGYLLPFELEDIPYLLRVRGLSIWHNLHLHMGIRKATEGFLPGGPVLIYSLFAL